MSDGAYVLVFATHTRVCQSNSDSTFLQLVVIGGKCGARIVLDQNDVSSEIHSDCNDHTNLTLKLHEREALRETLVVQDHTYVFDCAVLPSHNQPSCPTCNSCQ